METSEIRNKVEELVEVLVDTALFIIFLALDWIYLMTSILISITASINTFIINFNFICIYGFIIPIL